MASEDCVKLLLSAGEFARLSATAQRTKLVIYYQPWFSPGWKPDTVNNIRANQRLITHAKAMAAPVGTVLMAILEEASGLDATQQGSRGLLDVEVDQATYFEAEPAETIPAVTDMVSAVGDATPEPMADTPTLPAPSGPRSRSKRAK
jgi:hypothetical protein